MAAVLLGAESVAQAKTLIQSIKSNAYNGGATGVVPPQRRQPVGSSVGKSAQIDYSYNGYFTLKLIEIVNEDTTKSYKVRIVDGATYDPDTGTSGDSVAKVNNITHTITNYESEILTEYAIFALQYTKETNTLSIVNIVDLGYSTLPSDTKEYSYCQLGRVLFGDIVSTSQDHVIGVAQLWYYFLCSENT